MPFKMTKWSDNLFKFLDLYEKNECLWNPRVEEYTLKGSRDAAIRNILKEMQIPGLTEADIKNKIKSIRTSYKRELTAMLQSKMNLGKVEGAELYEPKLSWFKRADKFLHDVSVNKKANNFKKALMQTIKKEVFESIKEKDDETEAHKEIEIIQLKTSNEADANYEEEEEDNFDEEYIHDASFNPSGKEDNQNSTVNMTTTDPIIYRIEQQSHSSSQNVNRKRLHSVHEGSINEISLIHNEDEFELFGKSIAAQLKRMPLYNAVICQEKIQSIMTQERISVITQSSNKKYRQESHSYQ